MPIMSDGGTEQTLEELGRQVRAHRRQQGLTLRELAEKSGVSERFLSDVETGRGNVSVARLASIAAALGTGPAALLGASQGGNHARLQAVTTALARLGTEELAEVERWIRGRFGERGEKTVIALLGLRGAGKSTIGEAAAKKLGCPFIELDSLIEAEAGLSLGELFALHGEAYYRRLELQVLQRVLEQHPRAVIATGGGIVQSPEAFALLDSRCVTVWLRARPDEHWERVIQQGDVRPMKGRKQAREELERLLASREPLYARAHHTLDTSTLGVAGSVEKLRELTANG